MMKFAFNLIVTLGMSFSLLGQGYKIAYNLHYPKDTLRKDSITTERFILIVDAEKNSRFDSEEFRNFKSSGMGEGTMADAMQKYRDLDNIHFRFKILKNFETRKIWYIENRPKRIAFEKNLSDYNWIIGDSTTTISGFPCRIAHLKYDGNEYEAFYTEEIGIFDGPYLFYGLPGLILSLENKAKNYKFLFDGNKNYTSNYKVDFNLKVEEYSNNKSEYLKILNNYKFHHIRMMYESGDVKSSDMTPAETESFIRKVEEAELEKYKHNNFELEIF